MSAARQIACLVLAGCGRLHFDSLTDPLADARDDAAPLCTTFGPWSVPVLLSAVSTPINDEGPALSPDQLTLFFQTEGTFELYSSHRASLGDPFPAATPVTAVNSPQADQDATLAGNHLYFSSSRTTEYRLYSSTVQGTTFSSPILIPELPALIVGPTVSPDELELFYSDGAVRRTTRPTPTDPWSPPTVVSELGSMGFPSLTRDGLTIFLESNTGNLIYTATRPARGSPFTAPVPVSAINAPFMSAGDPEISADGLTIYFAAIAVDQFDLYTSTRTCM